MASRRRFLQTLSLGSIVSMLTACSPSAPAPTAAPPTSAPVAQPTTVPPTPVPPTPVPEPPLTNIWSGKTVNVIVADAAGGGFDTLARLTIRHMPKHLPGNPLMVANNMPGANHKIGTNFVYAARPDGLTIAFVDRTMPTYQLRGEGPDEGVRYDSSKLTWIGSTSTATQVLLVHTRSGVAKGDDLRTTEVKIGNAGLGGPPHIYQVILQELLGWKLKSVYGYQGNTGIQQGIDRGEVNAIIGSWSSILRDREDDMRSGAMVPVVQLGREPITHPFTANSPMASALIRDKGSDAAQLLTLAEEPFTWAWPVIAPPDMEPRMAAGLRAAFMATMADPEFQSEAARLRIDVAPVAGDRVQELVIAYMRTPASVVERLDALIKADAG